MVAADKCGGVAGSVECRSSLPKLLLYLRDLGFEFSRRHELVEIPVEHLLRIAALHTCAQVLHYLVELKHIGADLVAQAMSVLLASASSRSRCTVSLAPYPRPRRLRRGF